MQSTGAIEKTVDKDFEEEERRFKVYVVVVVYSLCPFHKSLHSNARANITNSESPLVSKPKSNDSIKKPKDISTPCEP